MVSFIQLNDNVTKSNLFTGVSISNTYEPFLSIEFVWWNKPFSKIKASKGFNILLKDIEYSDTGAETAPSDSGSDSSGGEDEFGGSDSSFGGSDDFGGSDSDFGGSESSESETASEDTGATE